MQIVIEDSGYARNPSAGVVTGL